MQRVISPSTLAPNLRQRSAPRRATIPNRAYLSATTFKTPLRWTVVRAEPEEGEEEPRAEVVRELKEETGEVSVPSEPVAEQPAEEAKAKPTAYVDELPQVKQAELSKGMKDKMRQEYLGLGGAENTKMGANYFLWIIVGISALAVATWLTGAI